MRQIKASEVKPGMTIRWGRWDISYQCTLARVERFNGVPGVQGETRQGKTVFLRGDDDVLVVKEPAQPEEPTEFGACVRVDGVEYIRDGVEDGRQYGPWFTPEFIDCSRNHRWEDLTARGQVEVVNSNPFARVEKAPEQIPATPEVPDRITEWPEDDTALRAFPWRDALGLVWRYGVPGREHGWSTGSSRAWKRLIYGPWHREKGAEVPDRIEEWPEDDEHLREHKWRDRDGYRWTWIVADAQWECRDDITEKKTMTAGFPADGPWTRVTDV